MNRSRNFREDLLPRLRETPSLAIEYLNACLEGEDGLQAFLVALRDVVDSQTSVAGVARDIGLSRVAVHNALKTNGNPRVRNLERILAALGLQLAITSKKTERKDQDSEAKAV